MRIRLFTSGWKRETRGRLGWVAIRILKSTLQQDLSTSSSRVAAGIGILAFRTGATTSRFIKSCYDFIHDDPSLHVAIAPGKYLLHQLDRHHPGLPSIAVTEFNLIAGRIRGIPFAYSLAQQGIKHLPMLEGNMDVFYT